MFIALKIFRVDQNAKNDDDFGKAYCKLAKKRHP